jgi:hypothetical protein
VESAESLGAAAKEERIPRRKTPHQAFSVVSKIDRAPTTIEPAIDKPVTAQARVTRSRVESLVADLSYRWQR